LSLPFAVILTVLAMMCCACTMMGMMSRSNPMAGGMGMGGGMGYGGGYGGMF
jgi:hypothetical protein